MHNALEAAVNELKIISKNPTNKNEKTTNFRYKKNQML